MHIQAQKFAQLLSQHLTLCFFAFSLPLCLETCNIDRHVDTGFSGDSANSRKVLVLFFFGYGSLPPFCFTAAPVMDNRELRIERRQKMFKKSCQSPQPIFMTSRKTSLPAPELFLHVRNQMVGA